MSSSTWVSPIMWQNRIWCHKRLPFRKKVVGSIGKQEATSQKSPHRQENLKQTLSSGMSVCDKSPLAHLLSCRIISPTWRPFPSTIQLRLTFCTAPPWLLYPSFQASVTHEHDILMSHYQGFHIFVISNVWPLKLSIPDKEATNFILHMTAQTDRIISIGFK